MIKTNLLIRFAARSFEAFVRFITLPLRDRSAQVVILLVAFLWAGFVVYLYVTAENALERANFEDKQSYAGTIYFGAPRKLVLGAKLDPDELVNYMRSLNFGACAQATDNSPGTYCLERYGKAETVIRVYSRLIEMPDVEVVTARNRITSLRESMDGRFEASAPVAQTSIEPETLRTVTPMLNLDRECASLAEIRASATCRTHSIRRVMQPSQFMNSVFVDALIASEDPHFYEHAGINWKRVVGAAITRNGGASTIPMQVVKNAVLFDATQGGFRGRKRKLQELFAASLMSKKFSKEQVIGQYVNAAFMGSGPSGNLLGYCAAAEEYFDSCDGESGIHRLTLANAAVLVANTSRPSRLSVLSRVADYPRLTAKSSRAELVEDFRQALPSEGEADSADNLVRTYGVLLSLRDSILIKMHQRDPEKYSETQIAAAMREPIVLARRAPGPLDQISLPLIAATNRKPELDRILRKLDVMSYANTHVFLNIEPDVLRASGRALAAVMPKLAAAYRPETPMIQDGNTERPNRLLGALLVMDPHTGSMLSLVGGTGEGSEGASVAINRLGSPYSTVKPFWAAMALERGFHKGRPITAASVPAAGDLKQDLPGLPYRPEYSHGSRLLERLRPSLASSRNDTAMWLFRSIGGADTARELFEKATGADVSGIEGQLAIGTVSGAGVSMAQMARAYSAFATGGVIVADASLVHSVVVDGKPAIDMETIPESTRLFSAPAAYVTTQMMRATVGYGPDGARGTAAAVAKAEGINVDALDIAGKTGSGDFTWMISIHPRSVIVATVGYEVGAAHSQFKAASTAAKLWASLVHELQDVRPDLLEGHFQVPPDVLVKRVDATRGCVVDAGGLPEYFIARRIPPRCSGQ